MASLKLYLLVLSEYDPAKISVHRDLNTLESEWNNRNRSNSVGIIHIGFFRPKPSKPDILLRHKGHILVTTAAKWALPEIYRSSKAIISELKLTNQAIPLHLLLKGIGYDLDEPSAHFEVSTEASSGNMTIVDAAQEVLANSDAPINKEEIFARISERGLYKFGAKKPVSVLDVELNRHTVGTKYSNPGSPLFKKLPDNRYLLIDNDLPEFEGWLKSLSQENPGLAEAACSYGIYNEDSYEVNRHNLSNNQQNELDVFRFYYHLPQVDRSDPQSVVGILPKSVLESHVTSIELPVRVLNVLMANDIQIISGLSNVSSFEMSKWPNFGKKSINDLTSSLINAVKILTDLVKISKTEFSDIPSINPDLPEQDELNEDSVNRQFELASSIPLKTHFQQALDSLKEKDRRVIECRTGYNGQVMTLEAVGELIGVTRERIRQIQKRYVGRIIEREYWDDCIAYKIGQLLIDRTAPLYLEMLEIEDPWFQGFMGNYSHLASIIELFSENEIRVIKINGASVVTRIKADAWDYVVTNLRKSLKDKAEEGGWTRQDIEITLSTELSQNGAEELFPLLWGEFEGSLQFESEDRDAKLIGFGKSAEAAVSAVLARAEKPLHYSEIAERAAEIYGKPVNERLAHNASPRLGAKLYGRGVYGLPHHNPISDRMSKNLQLIVSKMIQDGPLMKQWHCAEIISQLKKQFPALPIELDHYILNIILEDVENISYLNRMVWARSDSGQSANDRVDMADAFTRILEDNGEPLKGKELKDRLSQIRGVVENLQIQPSDRMIQIGPDFWGLIDRDIGGSKSTIEEKLNSLHEILNTRQKGIHVSEVERFIEVAENSTELPSAYALLNLAQRDDRFYLGRSMFVGLSEWGSDTRRINISQAVRKLLDEMTKPMTIAEISMLVEDMVEMPVDIALSNVLINEGAIYDQGRRTWTKGLG